MIEETELPVSVENEPDIFCPAEFAAGTRGILKGTYGQTKEEIDAYLKSERDYWGSQESFL